MKELYKLAKEQGYEGKKDILSIHSWLMNQGFCPLVGGVKRRKYDEGYSLQWTIEFYEFKKWSSNDKEENWHNSGFKFANGTYEDAMIDAMKNALSTMKRQKEDPNWLAKALANAKFVPPGIDD